MAELLLFAGVFALSAGTPGPDTMLVFGRALSEGPLAAVPYGVGLVLGKLVLLTLAVLGVAAAAAALGPLFVAVKVAGAAYLIWLGVRLLRRSGLGQPPVVTGPRAPFLRATALGAGLTVSNPQAILFYVAVLPQVIGSGRPSLTAYLALCATLASVMAVVVAVYVGLAKVVRTAAPGGAGRRRTDRVAGVLMIAAGGIVAAR